MKKFFIMSVLSIAGMLMGSCSADDEAAKSNADVQLEGGTGGGSGGIPPPPPPPPPKG